MSCPVCGYAMTEFEKECARCKNLGARKPDSAAPGASHQAPQPEYRPQLPQSDRSLPAAYQPNWVNIGLMWGLSVLAIVITLTGGLFLSVGAAIILVLVMNLVAIVLAFMLAGSDSPTDKINGRVMLGLAAASWLLRVVASLHAHG